MAGGRGGTNQLLYRALVQELATNTVVLVNYTRHRWPGFHLLPRFTSSCEGFCRVSRCKTVERVNMVCSAAFRSWRHVISEKWRFCVSSAGNIGVVNVAAAMLSYPVWCYLINSDASVCASHLLTWRVAQFSSVCQRPCTCRWLESVPL